jgi:hypothetical protein
MPSCEHLSSQQQQQQQQQHDAMFVSFGNIIVG